MKARAPISGPMSDLTLRRSVFVAWEFLGFLLLLAVAPLAWALLARQSMTAFLTYFVAGPIWLGIVLGALFPVAAARSNRRHPPRLAPAESHTESPYGLLIVMVVAGLVGAGLVIDQLVRLHAGHGHDLVAAAGRFCGMSAGVASGVGAYALWLRRLERRIGGTVWHVSKSKPGSPSSPQGVWRTSPLLYRLKEGGD